MTYIRKSVKRAPGNPGIDFQPRDLLALINIDDILFMPAPDEKGVVIADNIVMKPGRYAIEFYMTQGTVEATSAAEGDTDKIGFKPVLKFQHPGNEQEVREFKTNELNSKFIAVMRYCSGRPSDLIGSICNPCRITPSYTGNNEGSSNEFTVEQISKGSDIYIYKGTIPLEEPVSVVDAAATDIKFVSEGQYQLTAGNAAIESITGGSHDAVVTILGCEGQAPVINASAGKILLRGGKAFTATGGSQLTLRAFDMGGDSLVWIEQSRYISA